MYGALSYVWGDTTQSRTITCNGQAIQVTINLADALFRLRDEQATELVWIDALCIDQDNVLERNQQVKLMKDIYTKV
jgi:hypothetical protein